MADLFTQRGAEFSAERLYRYRLWRTWARGPALNALMLNPSTADEQTNDPTVERMERRARAMGFSGLVVTNLFAYRSTDPSALYAAVDPIGPDNDQVIRTVAAAAGLVLCGWGKHGALMKRGERVLQLLRQIGVTPHALKVNGDGSPMHPLYVGYSEAPKPYQGSEAA